MKKLKLGIFQMARKYWNKLKERLEVEGSQSVTNCHRLKLVASDGKFYLTDVASPETLLRLIQSIPSAKVGHERLKEIHDRDWQLRAHENTTKN
jgi:hypothetical protein